MEFFASLLLCVNIFFVQALRQWKQIQNAMNDETLTSPKNESNEAMKRLTLAKKLKR
jgi:hypothetical protein